MLYVGLKSFADQLGLLEHLAAQGDLDLVCWLYPKAELPEFSTSDHELEGVDPVTTYPQSKSTFGRCTARRSASPAIFAELRLQEEAIVERCDSLALYSSNGSAWVACTVGHEGMALVASDDARERLTAAGFTATVTKPDWW